MITSWSPSKLHAYEFCPHSTTLTAPRTQPEKTATSRGTDTHKAIEAYITSQTDTHPIVGFDPKALDWLRNLEGKVVEDRWAFDMEWNPVAWETAWARFIPDVYWKLINDGLFILDFKTGQEYPIKHEDDANLYALAAFKKWPHLTHAEVSFWYLDQWKIQTYNFEPHTVREAVINARVFNMMADKHLYPKPNKYKCPHCKVFSVCEYGDDFYADTSSE